MLVYTNSNKLLDHRKVSLLDVKMDFKTFRRSAQGEVLVILLCWVGSDWSVWIPVG